MMRTKMIQADHDFEDVDDIDHDNADKDDDRMEKTWSEKIITLIMIEKLLINDQSINDH